MIPAVPALFPPPVAIVFQPEPAVEAELLGPEAGAAAGMSTVRRRRFAAGREAARSALSLIGGPRTALPRDGRGVPVWPPGFVGSITHCDGLVGAAAAPAARFLGIGLDAEPRRPLPGEVIEEVLQAEERAWIERLDRAAQEAARLLVFSAKETLFKCWFPLVRMELGFGDIILPAAPTAGRIEHRVPPEVLRALPAAGATELRYDLGATHVVTAACLWRGVGSNS